MADPTASNRPKSGVRATRSHVCLLFVASTIFGSLSSGCFLWTTRGEGDQISERVQKQAGRLERLEQMSDQRVSELREAQKRATQSQKQLERVIKQASGLATRNSADANANVQALQDKIQTLDGKLDELRNRLDQVNADNTRLQASLARLGQKPANAAPVLDVPPDRIDHFATAYRTYTDRDFKRSRALFRAYRAKYGDEDSESDNALYWIATAHLSEGQPRRALGVLHELISNYPRSDARDEALFSMSKVFYMEHACGDARTMLKRLIREFPDSDLVPKARKQLRKWRRPPRGYCAS